MIKIISKKKVLLIVTLIVTCMMASAFFFMKKDTSKEEEGVREREYPVKRGDIVVGIDSKGVIKLKGEAYTFKDGVVLGKYNIKVGDAVKKGDILAELSLEDLEKKKDESINKLKEAENALSKARSDKELFSEEANKKVYDIKKDGEAAYNGKLSEVNSRIAIINKKVASIQSQIVALQEEKKKLEAEEANAERIAQINGEIAAKQTEIKSAKDELAIENSALASLNTERNREIEKEKENIDLLKRQNDAQLKSLQGALDSAQRNFHKANKELEELDALIASPKIEAKIDGVVLSAPYSAGDTISPAKAVVEIGDMSKQILTLFVDPVDVIDVNKEQAVSFYVDAYPEDTFTGKVESRSYLQNEDKKVEVIVSVDANEAQLLQGMGASATIILKEKKDVLTLANKAIVLKDKKQIVKVKRNDGTVEEREVTTGFSDGRVSEILSGLEDGDIVISEG